MSRVVVGGAERLLVRREVVTVGATARLLYASDLHLGLPWTRRVPDLLATAVDETRPDAVLLGGDLVERDAGLRELHDLVERLRIHVQVAAVPGNHDQRAGRDRVREAVVAARGIWLPEASMSSGGVRVDGRVRSKYPGQVLCAHDPTIWPRARDAGYTLTMAGHLHGCQMTLATRAGREYPGAWFYRWNGARFEEGERTLLVSRGVADTLPLRWNCPHDVLLVECV